ncbi:MAG: molybdate ABC transporter substrate-binding protein, partial [Deltaproteobacteria bacterium]|nr:molybdate ABC transporter substrate-binding protein [Deltaproteobacteria bacterium]
MKIKFCFLLILFFSLFLPHHSPASSSVKLLLFAGAASKPAAEEVIKDFQKKTAIPVEAIFGGSGFVLSQMKLSKRGDIYFPGSSDFMELAKKENLVYP